VSDHRSPFCSCVQNPTFPPIVGVRIGGIFCFE
jgi:hypothetical protein